ncbi:hypothetical protein V6N13_088092 [Hibiscus sabdariffa]
MGGKALTDAVFLLWFSTVKVSTDAVHCLVVGKVGSATSPPVEVDIASAALRENVQKPPKAFFSKQSASPLIGSSLFGILHLVGFVFFHHTLIPSK